jgi:hypothetical protein
MSTSLRVALAAQAVAALALAVPAAAQQAAAPVLPAAPDAVPQRGGEPVVERKVIEDDGVRIEELRVRGQTQRIVVRSKLGNTRAYEIVPHSGGRDVSQDKGSTGQRVWQILSF